MGDASAGISFEHGTIFDALRRAKVPFRIYAGDGFPQVGLLSGISLYYDVDDFANFAGDVNDPTYDAAYTFIEPRYDTISQNLGLPFVNNSQHPANSVELGEALIKTVYETIRNSPHWNQSMLIITWDEHGGFFDHVTPPPAARIPTGSPPKDIEGKESRLHVRSIRAARSSGGDLALVPSEHDRASTVRTLVYPGDNRAAVRSQAAHQPGHRSRRPADAGIPQLRRAT